ncbi:MAG: hypothetical protein DMF78_18165, partial [Acidobacteria bacterium]
LSDFRVDHQGRLKFEGLLGGGKTEIHLQPLRDGRFQLHLEAERLSLAGLSNPLTVELRIGDDVGRLVTAARIEREDEEEETHSRQHER